MSHPNETDYTQII